MRLVYVTPRGTHFHGDPECRRIRCGQAARRSTGVSTVMVKDVAHTQTPCLTCFPDAPRVRSFHSYCDICTTAQPCPHNGGVLVEVPRTWKTGSSLLLGPGERTVAVRYVWPEVAHRYPLVSQ